MFPADRLPVQAHLNLLKHLVDSNELHTFHKMFSLAKALRCAAGGALDLPEERLVSGRCGIIEPDLRGFGAEDAEGWGTDGDADMHRAAVIRQEHAALREDSGELTEGQERQ